MKGVYLGACRAYHPNYYLDYNDIIPGYHNNIICDMLQVDLTNYDFLLLLPLVIIILVLIGVGIQVNIL